MLVPNLARNLLVLPLTQVKLVACVQDKDEQSTYIQFTLEDSTGLITAKQWVNQDDETEAKAERRARCE